MTIHFDCLDLSPEILSAINGMGFKTATPIQAQGIPLIMAGSDVLGQAQTGTGKTLAFGIPAIEAIDADSECIQAIVLCPTRELAVQVSGELKKVAAAKPGALILSVYGGQDIDIQLRMLKKKPQIIVGTPGRVLDHIKRGSINLKNVSMLILDEADEMLNMGFRDDLEAILSTINKDAQKVFFSATMAPAMMKLTEKYLREPERIKIKDMMTVAAIDQVYYLVREQQKMNALCRVIDAKSFRKGLVFCTTKNAVDEMNHRLKSRGYQADALHGGLDQKQRDQVMRRFRSGGIDILAATDVASRGLDVEDIDMVINYDLPLDAGTYVHRIGRTGRAGRSGVSYSFVTSREQYKLRDIMNYTKAKIQEERIPSMADVLKMQTDKILGDVKSTIDAGALKAQARIVENWEAQGFSQADISAALLKMLMSRENAQETNSAEQQESFKADFIFSHAPEKAKKRSVNSSKSKKSPFDSPRAFKGKGPKAGAKPKGRRFSAA
ncbi:ATP-dependent RNA helicase [Deltaproteobacteria bacterium Smac51]|nr:ATP-dependent RNA helicase [Deltaproteobacteria bacterium Smac51]